MKKNGYVRRFLALFLTLMMIMADLSVTTFAATVGMVKQQNSVMPGKTLTYRDVLGKAVNYGIVTNTLTLGGHVDTNFAAGSLEGERDITVGKYTGEHNPGNIIIGDIPSKKEGFWAYSSTEKPFVITTTAEAVKYIYKYRDYVIYDIDHTSEELKQKVESMRTGTMSVALADESKYQYYTLSNLLDSDGYLNLKSYEDGTFYIKVDDSSIWRLEQAEGLKIKLNDNQNIVFYIPNTNVSINKFNINEKGSDDNRESADPYARRIIWNMPNATSVKIDNTFGVFLCPNAAVSLGGTSSGWVVSRSFKNNGE